MISIETIVSQTRFFSCTDILGDEIWFSLPLSAEQGLFVRLLSEIKFEFHSFYSFEIKEERLFGSDFGRWT